MATTDPLDAASLSVGPALAEFTRRISIELVSVTPELPSFPEVALRVRRALAKDDVAIDDVVRIVSAEPSLAVRLLRLANSVAVNPNSRRVLTLRAAIARMGFNLARSATIAFAMSQMRRADTWRGLEAQFREIWESSARLAAMGYALAKRGGRADADQALLAGTLSAVGRLFVLTRVSAFPMLMVDLPMRREIENVWQVRAARALLTRWELDEAVVAAASDFDQAEAGEGPATLSDVLLAARYLAGVQDLAELATAAFLEAAPFRRLGLDAVASAEVLNASAVEIASLRAALAD